MGLCFLLALFWLNYTGRTHLSAVLLCGLGWGIVTIQVYAVSGLFNPLFNAYSIVIIMAALLLNTRATIAFTVLSLLSGVYFLYAAYQGVYRFNVDLLTAPQVLFDHALLFVTTAFMLRLAIKRIQSHARALRQSEAKYRSVMNSAPNPIMTVDRDCRVTFISQTRYVEPKHLVGKRIFDFALPEGHESLQNTVDRVLNNGESCSVELRLWRLDGNIAWYTNYMSPLWDEDKIIGATIMAVDTTEQRDNHQARVEAERLYMELSKEHEVLDLKERFISTLSHDFRAPLQIILSAKDNLQKYYERMSPERRQEHFHNMDEQIQIVNTLLDDVLTIGKVRSGKFVFNPAPLNLALFCEDIISQIRLLDNNQHNLVFNPNGDLTSVNADAQLLRHMLMNLLSNATKYSPPNTAIEISTEFEGDTLILKVVDHGMGVPQEQQSRLFEPFFRASNVVKLKGTGLGLAIVKESVTVHGGTIECESVENVGTTFIVRLPLTPVLNTQSA